MPGAASSGGAAGTFAMRTLLIAVALFVAGFVGVRAITFDKPLPEIETPFEAPPALRDSRPDDHLMPRLRHESRERIRDLALQALRQPGPALCGGNERDRLLMAMKLYYGQRDSDRHGAPYRSQAENVESEGAWSTPADQQIDGLVREFYTEGYLQPGDLHPSKTADQVLSGLKPRHHICADLGKS